MASIPGLDSFGLVSLVDLTRGDQQRVIEATRCVGSGTVHVGGWAAGPGSF